MLFLPTRWRAFTAALLLLALPLQGLAAACMLGCGQGTGAGMASAPGSASAHGGHGLAGASVAPDPELAPHRPHGAPETSFETSFNQDRHTHGHGDPVTAHDPKRSDTGTQHGGHHAQSAAAEPAVSDAGGSCSACAACSVGAALPACEAAFSARGQAQGMTAEATPGLAHTSPDGLERPPRTDGV